MTDQITQKVSAHYEALPYPLREPSDELKRTIICPNEILAKISHFCFAGEETFKNNFHILVAGGGTGDPTIYLAKQLKGTNAQITHLDLSAASIKVAKARAEVLGLNNIVWQQGSILDLPNTFDTTFDYINCTGVLHHMPDPGAGLSALNQVLKPSGAMSIMVYGHYGRLSIYPMQKLLKKLMPDGLTFKEQVDFAREIINALPKDHCFKRELPYWQAELEQDTDLYDLLLHCQDKAYTVDEIYDWIAPFDLNLIAFTSEQTLDTYNPETYIKQAYAEPPTQQAKHALAEILNGQLSKHSFYLSKKPKTQQDINLANVPWLFAGLDVLAFSTSGSQALRNNNIFRLNFAGHEINIPPKKYFADIIAELDNKKIIQQIIDNIIAKDNSINKQELLDGFKEFYDLLHNYNLMFSIPPECHVIKD